MAMASSSSSSRPSSTAAATTAPEAAGAGAAKPGPGPVKRVYAYAHGPSSFPFYPKNPSPSPPQSSRMSTHATGFLSDERSYKGLHFQQLMAEQWGQKLHLLNLNGPSGKPEGGCAATLRFVCRFVDGCDRPSHTESTAQPLMHACGRHHLPRGAGGHRRRL